MSSFLRPLTFIAVVALSACNQRVPLVDGPVSPTQPSPTPIAAQPRIASIEISPGAVFSNDGATGIVRLTGPALAPGLFVSMSSSDDAASVTETVGIPAGNTFGRFGVKTRYVGGDRTAIITAQTPGSSVSMPFEVWMTDAPFHFLFYSWDDEPVAGGGFARFVPSTATFTATCNRNQLRITVSAPGRDSWSATFKAPGDEPLTTNFFEANRIGPDNGWAGMDLVVGGRSCDAIDGHFMIDELDLTNNRVNLVRGEFQQECIGDSGESGRLWGQFRLENMPAGTSSNCLR